MAVAETHRVAHGLVLLDEQGRQHDEIAEIHCASAAFRVFVKFVDRCDLNAFGGEIGCLLVQRVGALRHGFRQTPIFCGCHDFVLGARDRLQNLAQHDDRVPEIAIVPERQSGQDLLQHRDCVAAVEQRRVRWQRELFVKPPYQIEAEAVEGADPHLGCILPDGFGETLGQFAGRPVREGQHEHGWRIDMVRNQRLDPSNKSASLAGAGTRSQEIGRTTMARGVLLGWIFREGRLRFALG